MPGGARGGARWLGSTPDNPAEKREGQHVKANTLSAAGKPCNRACSRPIAVHPRTTGTGPTRLTEASWPCSGSGTEDLPSCLACPNPSSRELADAEIRRWDARVDAWVKAHGGSLADHPAPEIQPWGYAMRIEGALVWTDDLA